MWYDDDRLCYLVSAIRKNYPDCAITLSVGERSRESYEKLFSAGANRYLLRHETATASHYAMLHPSDMDFANRMRCLQDLKEIGYQVGCGFMVGSAPSDFGTSGERPSVLEGVSASHGRHWAISFPERYAFCPL